MINRGIKFLSLLLATILFCGLLPSCSPSLSEEINTEEIKTEEKKPVKKEETKTEEKVETEEIPEETEEKVYPNPDEDDVMRVLMIGNSFCYYFPDELYEMAKEAGIKMQVCNVYYSGCRLQQHWDWLQDKVANYEFYIRDEKGVQKKINYTLQKCLKAEAWDVITIQQHFGTQTADSYDECYTSCNPYGEKLLNFLKGQHPNADFYFQQTWAYQVGYDGGGGPVPDTTVQSAHHENIRRACVDLCTALNLDMIPSGDAWALARKNPVIGDTLCNKGPGGDASQGDFYHDGTTGGGQYLNACVWFEVLTGRSCIGNTFRPTDYHLDENKAITLQKIAHQAVAAR